MAESHKNRITSIKFNKELVEEESKIQDQKPKLNKNMWSNLTETIYKWAYIGQINTFYALLCHFHSPFQLSHCHRDLERAPHLQQHSLSLSQIVSLYKNKELHMKVEILKYSHTKKPMKMQGSLYILLTLKKMDNK